MDTNLKSTIVPESRRTSADSDSGFDERGKAPTFHVQTGVRAGGFFDSFYSWWEGVADGFNLFDDATGAG
jgi:hypothetical protein